VSKRFGVDLKKPWNKLSQAQQNTVLYGNTRGGEEWEGHYH